MNATMGTATKSKAYREFMGWTPPRYAVKPTGDEALPYAVYERSGNYIEPVDYYGSITEALVAKLRLEWEAGLG